MLVQTTEIPQIEVYSKSRLQYTSTDRVFLRFRYYESRLQAEGAAKKSWTGGGGGGRRGGKGGYKGGRGKAKEATPLQLEMSFQVRKLPRAASLSWLPRFRGCLSRISSRCLSETGCLVLSCPVPRVGVRHRLVRRAGPRGGIDKGLSSVEPRGRGRIVVHQNVTHWVLHYKEMPSPKRYRLLCRLMLATIQRDVMSRRTPRSRPGSSGRTAARPPVQPNRSDPTHPSSTQPSGP